MKNTAKSTILLGQDLKSSSQTFTAPFQENDLSHGKATFRIHDFVKKQYCVHKHSVKKQEVFRKKPLATKDDFSNELLVFRDQKKKLNSISQRAFHEKLLYAKNKLCPKKIKCKISY